MSNQDFDAKLQLRREVVEMANRIGPMLGGDFSKVQALVETTLIVWAVWQDETELGSVGMTLVKGQAFLREVIASGQAQPSDWTAIPCTCAEQAEALRLVAGESDKLH